MNRIKRNVALPRATFVIRMNKSYEIPAVQGESALQMAISLMLRRYMESEGTLTDEDPPLTPGLMALHFAWWLFDHPEELEAAAVQMEATSKQK
jgi:hypothetical protein